MRAKAKRPCDGPWLRAVWLASDEVVPGRLAHDRRGRRMTTCCAGEHTPDGQRDGDRHRTKRCNACALAFDPYLGARLRLHFEEAIRKRDGVCGDGARAHRERQEAQRNPDRARHDEPAGPLRGPGTQAAGSLQGTGRSQGLPGAGERSQGRVPRGSQPSEDQSNERLNATAFSGEGRGRRGAVDETVPLRFPGVGGALVAYRARAPATRPPARRRGAATAEGAADNRRRANTVH